MGSEEELRERVQHAIEEHLALQEKRLAEVGPELGELVGGIRELLAGGKRLRAAFCYWAWRGAGGPDCAPIVKAATSLELFQAAALLHDDVMDGSDLRRGQPALHRRLAAVHADRGWSGDGDRFGEAAAILAGDLCLAWSDELLTASGLSTQALAAGRATFDLMRTQLMGGQYLDVLEQASSGRDNGASVGTSVGTSEKGTSVERALQVLRFKSAKYTVEHPLLLGGALAGAGPGLMASYSAYGLPLGEAFQLRDDVLGVFGDPERTGKPAGDDIREGKRTVLIAQLDRLGDRGQIEAVDNLLGNPSLTDPDVERAREILARSGALAAVEKMIGDRVAAARTALAASPLSGPAADALAGLIETATDRQA